MPNDRAPRNLRSAFGPYCSDEVHPMIERASPTASIAGFLFVGIMIIFGAALLVFAICGGWSA